jgi:hypothetical protein
VHSPICLQPPPPSAKIVAEKIATGILRARKKERSKREREREREEEEGRRRRARKIDVCASKRGFLSSCLLLGSKGNFEGWALVRILKSHIVRRGGEQL